MFVQVSGKGFELSSELRDHVEERISTALDRFTGRISKVNVFLADENGPKNGLDKSLRLVINIERLPLIVVEERGESWYAVLDQAAERAVHAVSRQVDRVRSRTDRTSMAGDGIGSHTSGLEQS
jgi:putative sigma-54 modulation protein